MTTGKRQQTAKCVQSFELDLLITPLVLKKITAASPDQRAIYNWAWSGNSQATAVVDFWHPCSVLCLGSLLGPTALTCMKPFTSSAASSSSSSDVSVMPGGVACVPAANEAFRSSACRWGHRGEMSSKWQWRPTESFKPASCFLNTYFVLFGMLAEAISSEERGNSAI